MGLIPAVTWVWIWRVSLTVLAAVVALLAKRLYVIMRRNAVLRAQLTGPPGNLLLGEEQLRALSESGGGAQGC